jgi:hypothetical protein
LFEGGSITRHPFALRNHRTNPAQTEPEQILLHRRDKLGAAAGAIEIIVTEQECSAGCARPFGCNPERAGVSEMEVAGG